MIPSHLKCVATLHREVQRRILVSHMVVHKTILQFIFGDIRLVSHCFNPETLHSCHTRIHQAHLLRASFH